MILIETERLILREVNEADAPFILKLYNDPNWIKFIGDRNIKSIENAAEYIAEKIIKAYVAKGYGMYLVVLKKTKNKTVSIGQCGLVKREGLQFTDIGFGFLEAYCKQGYGYEAAKATLAYGYNKLGLSKIVGITSEENLASQRLLEKLGLKQTKIIELPNINGPSLYFE